MPRQKLDTRLRICVPKARTSPLLIPPQAIFPKPQTFASLLPGRKECRECLDETGTQAPTLKFLARVLKMLVLEN